MGYQDPRQITGVYYGSSHKKLLRIAHIDLEVKLDDLSVSWAARSLRAGEPQIRRILDEDVTRTHKTGTASWHDGTAPPSVFQRSGPIAESFFKTDIDRTERSYGETTQATPA